MMTNATSNDQMLTGWLRAVHSHIQNVRDDRSVEPRPKRNRARERARREARKLFRDYDMRLALQDLG